MEIGILLTFLADNGLDEYYIPENTGSTIRNSFALPLVLLKLQEFLAYSLMAKTMV
jgi:hypothetical protein